MISAPKQGDRVRFTEEYKQRLRKCTHKVGPCSCKHHEKEFGDRVGVLDGPFRPDPDFWDVKWSNGERYAYRLADLEAVDILELQTRIEL